MKIKNIIFVAKTRTYGIFVGKIYDYALIDSFSGSAGFLESPTSYVNLGSGCFHIRNMQCGVVAGLGCTGLFWTVLGCTGLYWAVLTERTTALWAVYGHFFKLEVTTLFQGGYDILVGLLERRKEQNSMETSSRCDVTLREYQPICKNPKLSFKSGGNMRRWRIATWISRTSTTTKPTIWINRRSIVKVCDSL